jgi:hypothetical protein
LGSNGSSNISNKFLPSLTDSIYTDIEASAAAEVQPAVSAVIKVDQKVVKAEKHLHRLQQQLESGDITFTFLKVGKPVLQYNCAEAQADADAAWREYQQKLLAAASVQSLALHGMQPIQEPCEPKLARSLYMH